MLGSVGAYEVAYWKLYGAVAGLLPVRSAAAAEAPDKHCGETVSETTATQTATVDGRRRVPPPQTSPSAAHPLRRQYSAVTIGFWLGGIALGIAGCLIGASMHHRHPVGVMAGALWWGIYFGCLGASIGAVLGSCADRGDHRQL